MIEHSEKLTRQFCKKFDVGTETSCWNWKGGCFTSGYGSFKIGRKNHRAHRVAFEFYKGSIPHGLNVLHSCDNPQCVNPAHLKVGTQRENIQDAKSKGRMVAPRGIKCHNAKLNPRSVLEIRSLISQGQTRRIVAAKFGIAKTTLVHVLNRESWNYVLSPK